MDKYLIDFLSNLKQYGVMNDIPNVSERGGRLLNLLVKITGAKNVLEVGCANGYSTIWLAEAVDHTGGKVFTFDFSKPSLDAARYNVGESGFLEFVDFHFGDFLKIFPKLKKPKAFDFVFVDGQKREYWDFWELIQGRLSNNALVVFDDVLAFPKKTDAFMKKIVNVPDFDHLILPIDFKDGILLLYKND